MSSKASLQRVHEDAALLNEGIAQGRAAIRGDEDDKALWLPRRRCVRRELLVLNAPVATLLIAVEHCDGVIGVDLHTVLASTHRSKCHQRSRVDVVKLGRALSTMLVLKPHTLRACGEGIHIER